MRAFVIVMVAVLMATSGLAWGQSAAFYCTLDDGASITATGGTVQGGTATFIPGPVGSAFLGNGAVYARWTNAAVAAIPGLAGWSNGSGVTVDLYFGASDWSQMTTVNQDSGFWGIAKRSPDAFLLIGVRRTSTAPKLRIVFANAGDGTQYKYTFDGGATTGETAPNLDLVNSQTYRLTVRQASGNLDVYINGSSILSTTMGSGWIWQWPTSASNREMDIGNRLPFAAGPLQTTQWVDNVRVYNGFYSPAELDGGGLPVAVISADKTSGFRPLTVNFDGSASHDTDATNVITSYAWDFENDGTVDATTATASHTYTTSGTFTAKLTVTDNEGQTASATAQIVVNDPPAAGVVTVTDMLPTGSLQNGSQILTSVTASGNTFTGLVGPTAVELVPSAANFVAFTNNGLCSLAPNIERGLMGLELGRGIGNIGGATEFVRAYFPATAVVSPDGTSKPEIFVLEYATTTDNFQVQLLTSGPGETPVIAATVPIRTLDYTATATQMASGRVGGIGIDLDALGVTGIKGVQIPGVDAQGNNTGLDLCVIAAVAPPAATFAPVAFMTAAPTSGGRPLSVIFSACGSYDPDGSIASYGWDFTNDGTTDATGLTASHVYPAAGTFTAKLTVTDNAGLTGSTTVQITVSPSANPIFPVTALTPDGGPLTGSQVVTSVTAGGQTITGLVGPPDLNHVEILGTIGGAVAQGLANVSAQQAMVGLELGDAALGLQPGRAIRVYFPDNAAVNPDGTSKPEIVVLEWAATTDVFQVNLLTNGPGQTPVVAGTVQVTSYPQTSTVIATKSEGNQPIGGVGIDLDALGLTGIRGIELPGDDGQGGTTGVDPCVIGAVVTTCHLPFADIDGDGDVDQEDFGRFQACLTNDPLDFAGDCFCFDRNNNGMVDDLDYGAFQACATGPTIQWSQALTPGCQP